MNGPTANDPSPAAAKPAGPSRWRTTLRTVCRYLLAAVFLAAALTKLTDLPGFTDRVVLHSGLPLGPARFAAALVPSVELVCGLCLFLGVAVREAAAILSLLLGVFLVYLLDNPADSDCGCLLF